MSRNFSQIIILCMIALSFPLRALAGGSEVGNGGDGVYRNQKLILRDLANGDVYRNPFIGTGVDPSLVALATLFKELNELDVDSTLFVRKLTDLERLIPGLGFIVFNTLRKYSFVLTDSLGQLEDDEENQNEPHVQIAIRQYGEIRISRETYQQLNQFNRVALLLHEGFYALGRQFCESGKCLQKSANARELTNLSFQNLPLTAGLRTRYVSLLDLGDLAASCESTKVRVTIEAPNGTVSTEFFDDTHDFHSQAKRFCWQISDRSKVSVRAQRVNLIQEVYTSPSWAQYAYRAKRATKELISFSTSRFSCEKDLEKQILELHDDPEIQAWQRFCGGPGAS